MTPNSKERNGRDECEHYALGPPDPDGVSICSECGSAVKVRVFGMSLSDWEDQKSTFIVEEGGDVPYLKPGEG